MKKLLIITILFSVPMAGMDHGQRQLPIFQAIARGDIEAVRHELRNGAQVDQKYDEDTPLCIATLSGHLEIAALLIEEHADVNRAGMGEQTPLHIAAQEGTVSLAELLLRNGADVNLCDEQECSPLYGAQSRAMVELLLTYGADINQSCLGGSTKLHSVAHNPDWVEFLLSHGAAMDLQDNWEGNTPLHRAVVCYSIDSVRILLEHRADRHIKNKKGETPLDVAQRVHGEDSKIYKLLNQSLVKGIAI